MPIQGDIKSWLVIVLLVIALLRSPNVNLTIDAHRLHQLRKISNDV